ncbi:MAG: endolytic transglycosylase MltG [Bacteroidales bacterium]|nr:endolytic transglycosylase MltG [Bacteroidales bacterium]
MKKVAVTIAAIAAVLGALVAFNWLRDNKLPDFSEETDLYVYPEMPVSAIADTLIANAGVRWPGRLHKVFEKHEVPVYCKPGHYVIKPGFTAVYVARMLNNGWQTPVRMVISGTLRDRGRIARKIANQMMVDSATVRNAFEDEELLLEFGFTPETVFALFVPDTYEMYWTASVKDIFEKQYEAYEAFWTSDNLAKARKLGLSQMEVSILASIVSGETNYVPEMPKIAGVYLNRLHKGMKLQADPTVAFCFGYKYNRILKRMLAVDSPYNTYKYAGLPPAPIYVPTRNTLNAVLNPDYGGGNLYFCADPSFNGSHRFARTYSEHLRNARAFQRALDKAALK